ncbi:glycosylphosphatidylinositol anchor attachment 1 protein-like [Physella acuta]|uniref:glycosylphosphatidylinositol anchor attachment 1 protein-like n=1 Tax=Physella acuta TaxID=109671 RepID=UPI0027DE73F4|nr:glycosylphosphatidylinositol anchor attachment 1 protein-like [Physella acuta]XP_059141220.1 glycosylphosphatidylinositol anchor attachment 1 protein-like [Physella acuta]
MGLLTSEKQRNRFIALLIKHNLKLCIVSYTAGLLWFLALAYQPLNAGTYFSENALLPGLVESDLPSLLQSAVVYKSEVEAELKKDTKVSPHKWIYKKFQDMGLETFSQNFSVVYPFKSISTTVVKGENIFSILRARRSASTEAIVLSVPLRPLGSKEKTGTGGGIALALALATEFKKKPYWSKDIIFLFSDFDEIGAMAWLDGYHQTKSRYILSDSLEGRSGPIIAAINLELPLENINYFNIKLEGFNGQLPNLDLVNLVVRLCRRERSQVALHKSLEDKGHIHTEFGDSFDDYKKALSTMLKMMWYQASGAPSGNHGLFQKFHIEAVTLEGVVARGYRSTDLSTTAKIIEGIFRSLNNLLERFHQSFFFYLLPSTSRYVSIGMYMPPFGLMALAGLIKGIALWVGSDSDDSKTREEEEASQTDDKQKGDTQTDKQKGDTQTDDKQKAEELKKGENKSRGDEPDPAIEKKSKSKKKELKSGQKEETNNDQTKTEKGKRGSGDAAIMEDEKPKSSKGVTTIVPVILISLLLSWMAHQGPELLTHIMPKFRIQTEDVFAYSLVAIFTAALVYPKLMKRKSSELDILSLDWQLLKSVALIAQTLALAAIAVLNISQAFFLTAFMVPVTTLVRPSSYRFVRWLQMIALVLVSPLCLMFIVGVISAMPRNSVLELLTQGFANSKSLIFLGIMDSYLFNAWTETIITAVIFPIWLLFWAIPWIDAKKSEV